MARKAQGASLTTLILQPGSEFTENEGGFDEGRRMFDCDTASATRIRPLIGMSDKRLISLASVNEGETGYPLMFVYAVQRVDSRGGLTRFTVSFRGIMGVSPKAKRRKIEEQAAASSEVESLTINGSVSAQSFPAPKVVVRVTYVGTRKPPIEDIGSEQIPPGFKRKFEARKPHFLQPFRSGLPNAAEGWMLADRTNREAGTGKNTLWETTDTHSYEVIPPIVI